MFEHEQTRGVPLVVIDGAEALIEIPFHGLVHVAQRPHDAVILIGIDLMTELHLLIDQRTHQHQRVLLVHQTICRAVHQHQVAPLYVASLHGQVRFLQGAQIVALQRNVALSEEGIYGGVKEDSLDARRGRFLSVLTVVAEADNGIDGHSALQHLLRVVDEHHGGSVAAVAPAEGADAQGVNELEIIPQVAATREGGRRN